MRTITVEGTIGNITQIKMEEETFESLRLGSIIEIDDTEYGGYVTFYRVKKIFTDKLVVTLYPRQFVKTYSVRADPYKNYPNFEDE